jgi:hypothetical protein
MIIDLHISVNYLIWMLENPHKLNQEEKEWLAEFKRMLNEKINDIENQSTLAQNNP